MTVLQSTALVRLGFLHGFSTRAGGVSEGEFASMNFGRTVGDNPEHVEENHRRLADEVRYETKRLYEASQVHGAEVLEILGDEDATEVRARDADALVTRCRGVAVGVRTADCVPVLLADGTSGAVAAVHVGWKGLEAGVVKNAVEKLGGEVRGLVAAIGPSIGKCCFEVGEDVALRIVAVSDPTVIVRIEGEKPKVTVDLQAAVAYQLNALGIGTVDTIGRCTVCEHEHFHSHRRDGERSGRMLAVIVA